MEEAEQQPPDTQAIITDILDQTRRLSGITGDEKVIEAVRSIGLLFRELAMEVPYTEVSVVEAWIAFLRDVPAGIGVRSDCGNIAQELIEGIRNSIEERLDKEWPAQAGKSILDPLDSGINLIYRPRHTDNVLIETDSSSVLE